MSLRQLETLIAITETGGFGAAAMRLGVTQSAVSMQIKALEAELGVMLFDRAHRPPLPTEQAFLESIWIDGARPTVNTPDAIDKDPVSTAARRP